MVYDTLRLVRSSDTCSMLDSVCSAEKLEARFSQLAGKQFQGICPKCGATGPKRESHQEALREPKVLAGF